MTRNCVFFCRYFSWLPLVGIAFWFLWNKHISIDPLDSKVLDALAAYSPEYELNSDGNVIVIKLEGRDLLPGSLKGVNKLIKVKRLSLYGTRLPDDDLADIRNLQELHNLGLGATPITNDGLHHLSFLQGLKNLWLPKKQGDYSRWRLAIKKINTYSKNPVLERLA